MIGREAEEGDDICIPIVSVSRSVMPNSLQCHGVQPARLLCP